MLSWLFTIACLPVALATLSQGPEPNVGWCAFYPGVDVGMDQLPLSGASVISVPTGSGWAVRAGSEVDFNFSYLDKSIEYAERNNLKLALISEINPVYTPGWLKEKLRAAGQLVKNAGGVDGDIPHTASPIFMEEQEKLVRGVIERVKQRDKNGVVVAFHPGAEWWFPHPWRYHPADVAQFRQWLQQRYRSIDKLNAAWKSNYASFDDVPAPRIDSITGTKQELYKILSADSGAEHCSWSTASATDPKAAPGESSFPAVAPGKTYTFSAWVRADSAHGSGAFCEVAWIGSGGGAPVSGGVGAAVQRGADWQRIAVTLTAPKDARRAWLLLKVAAAGTVTFDDVEFKEEGSHQNLAPNPGFESGDDSPVGWSFQNWTGGARVRAEYLKSGGRSNSRCLRVSIPPVEDSPHVYRNHNAAVNDWSNYWYEAAAKYINSLSQMVKRFDPSMKTVTYLTFSFAFPAEWDYTQQMAIAPDHVAMFGKDIDEIGMQVCAADGDPYRAIACLDLVRKYGKPMWAVDLVDFTSGVHIGYPLLDKITQATIQHGAKGIIYCCWHLPPVLDYSFHPHIATSDLNRMLTDARAAVNLMEDMKVRPGAAIVQPILPASSEDKDGFKNDFRSFMGWYKILESLHQTVDVITLKELEYGKGDLSKYRWVLVPDCAYIPRQALARLEQYAKGGGRLMTCGRFAQFDEIGSPIHTTLPPPIPDYGKAYAGVLVRDTHAGNTPPLFLWRKDTRETDDALRSAQTKVRAFLKAKGVASDFEVLTQNSGIRCVAYEGKGNRAFYLVNMEEKNAVGVRLRIRAARPSQVEVHADVKPVPCAVRRSGEWAELTLPEFRSSCIVKIGD